MSGLNLNSNKKFPYLVLQNGSGDDKDDLCSQGNQDYPAKVDLNSNNNVSIPPPRQRPNYHPYPSGQDYSIHTNGSNIVLPPTNYQQQNTNTATAMNLSKMKAVLTAQNELRKPASSLYPSSSQMSLIPETEEIYKKYFPNEVIVSPSPTLIQSSRKANDETLARARMGNGYSLPPEGNTAMTRLRRDALKASLNCSTTSPIDMQTDLPLLSRNSNPDVNLAAGDASIASSNPTGTRLGPKDVVENRVRKRIQSQFMTLNSELNRQSTEIMELRKDLKELRQSTRKSATEHDSSKSRIDTLSKHVQDLDSKVDSLQETISSQEKSLLSKLMMIGDISDSDSDGSEESSIVNFTFIDPTRPHSSSGAKLAFLAGSGKRSSGNVISATSKSNSNANVNSSGPAPAPSSASMTDYFPRVCSNWIPIAPDFDKLIQSIALLNYRMDRNQSMKMCSMSNGSGATFKHSDVIDLTLFKNGIILGNSGFRSYSTMSVIKFINELFNGYLPTELSTQYPDGVVIVLSDKRSLNFAYNGGFNGSGTKLVKEEDSPSDLPEFLPGESLNCAHEEKNRMDSVITNSTSLSSAPSTASASRISLSLTTSSSLNGGRELLPDLMARESYGESGRKSKIISLKLNDIKNGKKYKVKVPINSSVKSLQDHISKSLLEKEDLIVTVLNNGSLEEALTPKIFDIILPLPNRKLGCLKATFEEYGIIQNTLLFIREKVKRPTSAKIPNQEEVKE